MYGAVRPPLPGKIFAQRMVHHLLFSLGLIVLSIAMGMAGYEHFESLRWRDAFLNTAMLLGGMGPVDPPVTDAGKMFAGIFALYAGLVFLFVAGLLIAPVVHRIMHRFHWEQDEKSRKK